MNFEQARKAQGLTRPAAARYWDVACTTIFRWEVKDYKPQEPLRSEIANAWGVDWPDPLFDDLDVDAFVREHPDGATIREIADFVGIDPMGIHAIEQRALAKLRAAIGEDPRDDGRGPVLDDRGLYASLIS